MVIKPPNIDQTHHLWKGLQNTYKQTSDLMRKNPTQTWVNANRANTVAFNYGSGYAIEIMREHMKRVLVAHD